MTGSFSTQLFRIVFTLAGCYNLGFGLWAGFRPLQFFEIFGIAYPRYPAIWSCLGMVVGIYGLLYWYAAWKPEYGRPMIAIGLLGKVLGPIGMMLSFSDEWPHRLGMLTLYNDVIWWLPFLLFLLRGTTLATRLVPWAPWCCAGFHLLGLAAMGLFLRPGMLIEPDPFQRATYIAQHSTLWAVGWGAWMLAAVSLVAFYVWWGSRLAAPYAATVGVLLAALGSVFDLSGEFISVLVLVERSLPVLGTSTAWDPAGFVFYERIVTLLTAGAANLLYTLGGFVLMLWTVSLPRQVRWAMWGTWLSGLGMTFAAVFNQADGLTATTAVLFPLFIAWTVWMGRHGRRM